MSTGDLLANVTCVAVGGRGLLIEGAPGSGKSSLALALIDRGAVLVGDDGIAVTQENGRALAAPPPHIAGLLEIRGVGLVAYPTTSAAIALVLALGPEVPRMPEPGTRRIAGAAVPLVAFCAGDPLQAIRAEAALARFGLA